MSDVDTIKQRIDIAEYIGRLTPLKKSGRSLKGPCPFHQERTPSFYVTPARQTWHCFGACGAGGDLFEFVMRARNVDFKEALRQLAEEAGVQIHREDPAARAKRAGVSECVAAALSWYQDNLWGANDPNHQPTREAITAMDYLEKRGIQPDWMLRWGLGWAPTSGGLREHLTGRGYSVGQLVEAGLLGVPDDGRAPYDYLRGRIVFPITDERGIWIALSGRTIGANEPKYLNTPETAAFRKGATLFRYDLAREAIQNTGTAVVVEGHLDALVPFELGTANVVATMGTAMTPAHAALLRRTARIIVLAFDADKAGQEAIERAGLLFAAPDSPADAADTTSLAEEYGAGKATLYVANLRGKDPDEMARSDFEGWRRAITSEAVPYAQFALGRLLGAARPTDALGMRNLVARSAPMIDTAADSIARGLYIVQVADHLGIPPQAVEAHLRELRRDPAPIATKRARRDPAPNQTRLMAILARAPYARASLGEWPAGALFDRSDDRALLALWCAAQAEPREPVDPLAQRLTYLRAYPLPPEMTGREALPKAIELLAALATEHARQQPQEEAS